MAHNWPHNRKKEDLLIHPTRHSLLLWTDNVHINDEKTSNIGKEFCRNEGVMNIYIDDPCTSVAFWTHNAHCNCNSSSRKFVQYDVL